MTHLSQKNVPTETSNGGISSLSLSVPLVQPFDTHLDMASGAHRRLMKDYKELQSDTSLDGISAAPDPENLLVWRAVICGPLDTAWEGGIFVLSLSFAHDYPATPPTVKFLTQIFHPNGTRCV